MTAGWSKGRKQYYLYYRCHIHNNVNVPGKLLHEQFDEVLKDICFEPQQVEFLRLASKALLAEPLKQKQERLKEKLNTISAINVKILELEEKFMNNQIESTTYQTWFKKYKEEKASLEINLNGNPKSKIEIDSVIDRVLPALTNLFEIYEKCNIFQKHAIVRGVFKDNLVWAGGLLRTAFIDPTFRHNLQRINKKGLLFYEQPFNSSDISPVCTPGRTKIEPIYGRSVENRPYTSIQHINLTLKLIS